MMNLKKINAILNKICEVSELSRFEIIVGQGVGTQFGVKVEECDGGDFVEIKLYYECEVPGDILGRTQEMIYRSFVIDSDRVLYRFVSSDGDDTYYLPGNFGGFTAVEAMYIVNIMNLIEEGDN